MIDLYYCATPNGLKMALFFAETGLPHRVIPVDISRGDQFKPAFLTISPNNKIPTIVEPPIPSDMVMYLINAVYFKGSWTTEFEKKLTEDRTFTPAGGPPAKRPLMKQHGWLPFAVHEMWCN